MSYVNYDTTLESRQEKSGSKLSFLIQRFDDGVLDFIQINMRTLLLDKVMPALSLIENYGAVWLAVSLLLILSQKYSAEGFMLVFVLLLCTVLGNFALKNFVARVRPSSIHREKKLLIPRPLDFSFPSGHSMSSFAAATVLLLVNPNLGICGFVLASLIAFSRLYLYVHYPTDVIVGMVLGIFVAQITIGIAF